MDSRFSFVWGVLLKCCNFHSTIILFFLLFMPSSLVVGYCNVIKKPKIQVKCNKSSLLVIVNVRRRDPVKTLEGTVVCDSAFCFHNTYIPLSTTSPYSAGQPKPVLWSMPWRTCVVYIFVLKVCHALHRQSTPSDRRAHIINVFPHILPSCTRAV